MSQRKRQDLPSGLWVVATPIGNLGDLTQRAIQALDEADFILCEDTRRTAALLSALEISHAMPRLKRFDKHAKPKEIASWIKFLEGGKSLAVVSDGGTPLISDPGGALVVEAHRHGIRVTPIAGVSSITAFLSASGLTESGFVFHGFFPREAASNGDKIAEVLETANAETANTSQTHLWFESPKRLEKTLEWFCWRFPEAPFALAKELTKQHERFWVGTVREVYQKWVEVVQHDSKIKDGEWIFGITLPPKSSESLECSDWVKTLDCLLDAQVSASVAAREISQKFGIPRQEVYRAAVTKKKSSGD